MWQTIGQARVVDLFRKALARRTLAHAYLLVGPAQIGKMTLALDIARALNCQAEETPCNRCPSCEKIASGKHPDVQIIGLSQTAETDGGRTRTEVGIERVRDILHSASLPPFEGKTRVYIVEEASELSSEAANCLLKTLEEPEEKVFFILLTENIRMIPATIISRCQRINLARVKIADLESYLTNQRSSEASRARLLARLSRGCPGWAIRVLENPELWEERKQRFEDTTAMVTGDYNDRFAVATQMALQFAKKRDTVYEILDSWLGWWHDLLMVKTGCAGDITNIDFSATLDEMAGYFTLAQIKDAIQNIREAATQLGLNASPRLALEALMLNLPRKQIKNQGAKSRTAIKS